jgi:hypothetical protein
MSGVPNQVRESLERQGFVLLERVLDRRATESLADSLSARLHTEVGTSVLRSRGRVYGSRNLLETFPDVVDVVRRSALQELATAILGPRAGIVRALFFDKPPDRSWSLPWHRDQTIAVERNDLPGQRFRKPTVKAGVPHVEAPPEVLSAMLTLRIHLDAMHRANGPLSVIPGSHRRDREADSPPVELHAEAGDVLLMRPLLLHASSMSCPGTTEHRRVVHIEAAGSAELPDGYQWHSFIPIG